MTIEEGSGQLSIQERLFPTLRCFGCGPANPKGLRLRSYPAEGSVVAVFTPWPEHDNGLGYLNGGIIATVLDCHSAAVVLLEAERHNWTASAGATLALCDGWAGPPVSPTESVRRDGGTPRRRALGR